MGGKMGPEGVGSGGRETERKRTGGEFREGEG